MHEALKNNIDYIQPKNTSSIKRLIFDFGEGREIDVFHRSLAEYDEMLTNLGFKRLSEEYPLFPEEFITKIYPGIPKEVSEYMILGYGK